MKILTLIALICFISISGFAEVDVTTQTTPLLTINLPPAQTKGGKPLMEALGERSSSRSFSEKELPQQVLSNLLWAASGINRPNLGKFTAPTAHNMQEMSVFVATSNGLYLYQPKQHILKLILKEDIRSLTGEQEFVATAPVNLIYVADYSKMEPAADNKDFYSATDTGFISQNVYLYCASEGLVTVVRGWINKEALGKAMSLRPEQKIILAQSVGYPK